MSEKCKQNIFSFREKFKNVCDDVVSNMEDDLLVSLNDD